MDGRDSGLKAKPIDSLDAERQPIDPDELPIADGYWLWSALQVCSLRLNEGVLDRKRRVQIVEIVCLALAAVQCDFARQSVLRGHGHRAGVT